MAYLKSTQGFVYDNLNAPIGTKMVFNQTTAPLGWAKETGSNDVSLRLTSGTVGTGGSVAFETCFASQTPTITQPSASSGAVESHPLSDAESPSHAHNTPIKYAWNTGSTASWTTTNSGQGVTNYTENGYASTSFGSDNHHSHGFIQPTISTPTSSAINLDVSYVDVIIATKD